MPNTEIATPREVGKSIYTERILNRIEALGVNPRNVAPFDWSSAGYYNPHIREYVRWPAGFDWANFRKIYENYEDGRSIDWEERDRIITEVVDAWPRA